MLHNVLFSTKCRLLHNISCVQTILTFFINHALKFKHKRSRIKEPRHVRTPLHSPYHRPSAYYRSRPRTNFIYRSAATWLGCVACLLLSYLFSLGRFLTVNEVCLSCENRFYTKSAYLTANSLSGIGGCVGLSWVAWRPSDRSVVTLRWFQLAWVMWQLNPDFVPPLHCRSPGHSDVHSDV